jgi:hypothetical protein
MGETMLYQEHIRNLIAKYTRRLQILEQKRASYGLDTAPHILVEIEDLDMKIKNLRAKLKVLEKTALSDSVEDNLKRRVQIHLQGDFSSLSTDRLFAAITAFAAVSGISLQAIEMYRKEI